MYACMWHEMTRAWAHRNRMRERENMRCDCSFLSPLSLTLVMHIAFCWFNMLYVDISHFAFAYMIWCTVIIVRFGAALLLLMDYYGRKIFLFLMKFLKFLFDDFYCFIWALSCGWNISHKWFVYCVDEKLIASEIGCYLIMEHNWPWNHASTHSTFDFIVSMLTC